MSWSSASRTDSNEFRGNRHFQGPGDSPESPEPARLMLTPSWRTLTVAEPPEEAAVS